MRCACLSAEQKKRWEFCPVKSKWRQIRKKSLEEAVNRARSVSQVICCFFSLFRAPCVCPACTSHPMKANRAQICCSAAFYMAPRG